MSYKEFRYIDHLNRKLVAYKWLPDHRTPKGVVQLTHGMQEHARRYNYFAETLARHGFAVYATDLLGHGRNLVAKGRFGDLGPGGWQDALESVRCLSLQIKQDFPELPFYLFGHSWGSFLSQRYIQKWGCELAGVILSGTTGHVQFASLSVPVSKLICRLRGSDRRAGLLQLIGMGHFNREFRPAKTPADWLSRDEAQVQKFIKDPWCGQPFPNSFFYETSRLFTTIWRKENEEMIPRQLPVCIASGSRDPVSMQTRYLSPLAKRYQELGIKDVTMRIYPGARHEIINETNRDQVIQDLIDWIEERLMARGELIAPHQVELSATPATQLAAEQKTVMKPVAVRRPGTPNSSS
jgi:alpha-beta hydrolase superfamily lysophospholipase